MRPENLKTKIFLDGGDPKETREIIEVLGFLDGQTTNPTLIAKNPEAKARLERGEKFSEREIYDFYRGVVKEVSTMMPEGSVSIEVYADATTRAEDMLVQAREMNTWILNAHIKYPTTTEGLKAAEQSVKEGMRVNMTLCFSQEQAAAVYAATRMASRHGSGQASKGQVFVSPFVGRLDDKGENGMDLIKNILQMYKAGDSHVEVLSASVRTMEHFMYALALKSDIITAPAKTLREWAALGMPVPAADYAYSTPSHSPSERGRNESVGRLKLIPYHDIALTKSWQEYNIAHELTDVGIEKFSADWNALIKK